MAIKTCKWCGREFISHTRMNCCSEDCAKEYNAKYGKRVQFKIAKLKNCRYCGKEFMSSRNMHYCSDVCRKMYINDNKRAVRKNLREELKAETVLKYGTGYYYMMNGERVELKQRITNALSHYEPSFRFIDYTDEKINKLQNIPMIGMQAFEDIKKVYTALGLDYKLVETKPASKKALQKLEICKNCGKPVPTGYKAYCSAACRRMYISEKLRTERRDDRIELRADTVLVPDARYYYMNGKDKVNVSLRITNALSRYYKSFRFIDFQGDQYKTLTDIPRISPQVLDFIREMYDAWGLDHGSN